MAVFSNSTPAPGVSNIVTHPAQQRRLLRRRLEQAANKLCGVLDRIIAEMDAIDGDSDFEPSLGSVGASVTYFSGEDWAEGVTDDRELECEDEGAQCDDEGHDSDTEPNGDEDDCSRSEDEMRAHDIWAARNRDYASITGLLPQVLSLGFHGSVA